MAKTPRATLRLIDRLVLMVAWLVTCGLVFVLGFYLGKATPDERARLEERSVRLPITSQPPPEGQRPKEPKEFPSFYQTLPAGERPTDVARGTPATVPPATTATPTSLPRVTTTTAAGVRTTTSTNALGAAPHATTTVAPRAAGTIAPSTTLPSRTVARGGFTVEASPTRSRAEAEELLGSLRKRGYDAVLVQMQRDGDTWYRLRVGRYPTAEQATEVMRRLRDSEGVTHAFVAAE
jgi:cell division septation protein DedD